MVLKFFERKLLSQFLATMLDEANPDASLADVFEGATLPQPLPSVPGGPDLESRLEQWTRLLDVELAIIVLGEVTVQDFACKALERLRAWSQPAPPPDQDPFDVTTTLHPRKVFLDRAPLREILRGLADASSSKRILIVNGPPLSGKSLCSELIANVRLLRNSKYKLSPATIDLRKTGYVNPRDVIERLASTVSATRYSGAPTPSDSTSLAGRNTLVEYLFRFAEEVPGTHWFVIDSVKHWGSEGWKAELINEMLLMAVKEASRPDGSRLVLIDHDKPLPQPCEDVAVRVDLARKDIDLELHVRDFLIAHVPDAALIEQLLVDARTFANSDDWLDQLQELCSRVVLPAGPQHG